MDLWAVLLPILLADVINPVLLAAVIYELGSARPFVGAAALLLGHTAMYLAAGVALAVGIDAISERLARPEPVDFWIELFVGAALLGVGVAMLRGKRADPEAVEERARSGGVLMAFGIGAVVNLIGIPFAVPYFGAVSQILKAEEKALDVIVQLGAYNLLYALPFAGVIVAAALLGARAEAPLLTLNRWMQRASDVLVPFFLLAIGALFVIDAALFLLRGQPLIEF